MGIQELKNIGINMHGKYKENYFQTWEIECRAYEEISRIAQNFEIISSKWNSETDPNSFIFQVRKQLTNDEKEALQKSGKDGWRVVHLNHEKSMFLETKENDNDIDLEKPDTEEMQHESHVSLMRCVRPLCDLDSTDLQFEETLKKLLFLIKPLMRDNA